MGAFALAELRTDVINALCSNETLHDMLVLKGGNALSLVHKIGNRVSTDLDFSLTSDFENLEEARNLIEASLQVHLKDKQLCVFDVTIQKRPKTDRSNSRWLGYLVNFKIIEEERFHLFKDNPQKMSIVAIPLEEKSQKKKFTVDLSCHEYTESKIEVDLNDYPLYVYSKEMIGIEKMRALCQQMPEYSKRTHPARRPRDLYDIVCIEDEEAFVLEKNKDIAKKIFGAKDVPLELLRNLESCREFHRLEWSSVQIAVGDNEISYDTYFERTKELAILAESLWNK